MAKMLLFHMLGVGWGSFWIPQGITKPKINSIGRKNPVGLIVYRHFIWSKMGEVGNSLTRPEINTNVATKFTCTLIFGDILEVRGAEPLLRTARMLLFFM